MIMYIQYRRIHIWTSINVRNVENECRVSELDNVNSIYSCFEGYDYNILNNTEIRVIGSSSSYI